MNTHVRSSMYPANKVCVRSNGWTDRWTKQLAALNLFKFGGITRPVNTILFWSIWTHPNFSDRGVHLRIRGRGQKYFNTALVLQDE